jgi:hypothetical protein
VETRAHHHIRQAEPALANVRSNERGEGWLPKMHVKVSRRGDLENVHDRRVGEMIDWKVEE